MISYIHVFEFVELWQRCKPEIDENVCGSNPTIGAPEYVEWGEEPETNRYRNYFFSTLQGTAKNAIISSYAEVWSCIVSIFS